MSAERDVTRIVRSWLRTDERESADRILGIVLERLDTTPQRRPMWPPRRFPAMNRFLTLTAAATVLVVAAFAALLVFRPAANVGPPASPSAPAVTAAATPSALPSPLPTVVRMQLFRSAPSFLLPDDYALDHVLGSPMTITVPADWTGLEHGPGNALLVKTAVDLATGKRGAFGTVGNNVLLGFYGVDAIFADPCKDISATTPAPSGIDGYVYAPSNAVGMTAKAVTDVTIGGLPAKQLDLVNSIDDSKCAFRPFNQWTYRDEPGTVGGNGTSSPGHQRIWLLEVNGRTLLVNFEGSVADGSPAKDVAEIDAIVRSIRFE